MRLLAFTNDHQPRIGALTDAGVAHGRKPLSWMQDGDVVEVEIEKIGLLSNPVKAF